MNSFTASSSHLLAIANGTDLYEHSLQLKLKLQFASSFESSFKSCVQNFFDCGHEDKLHLILHTDTAENACFTTHFREHCPLGVTHCGLQ